MVAVGEREAEVFEEGLEKRTELYPAIFTHQLGAPLVVSCVKDVRARARPPP